MAEFDRNLPLLGIEKSRIRTQPAFIVSFVRSLDENGQFEPESTYLNDKGEAQAIAGRSNICSAEDLTDMIVDAVWLRLKDELRALIAELKN